VGERWATLETTCQGARYRSNFAGVWYLVAHSQIDVETGAHALLGRFSATQILQLTFDGPYAQLLAFPAPREQAIATSFCDKLVEQLMTGAQEFPRHVAAQAHGPPANSYPLRALALWCRTGGELPSVCDRILVEWGRVASDVSDLGEIIGELPLGRQEEIVLRIDRWCCFGYALTSKIVDHILDKVRDGADGDQAVNVLAGGALETLHYLENFQSDSDDVQLVVEMAREQLRSTVGPI
jgi:hypothetical protein